MERILNRAAKNTRNTIGTLLGGLAGYVLAQGVGRAAARAATTPAQTPTSPPAPGSSAGSARTAVAPAPTAAGFATPASYSNPSGCGTTCSTAPLSSPPRARGPRPGPPAD